MGLGSTLLERCAGIGNKRWDDCRGSRTAAVAFVDPAAGELWAVFSAAAVRTGTLVLRWPYWRVVLVPLLSHTSSVRV
jgi:hypothetical protein